MKLRAIVCAALMAAAVPGPAEAQVRRLYASGFSSPVAFVQDPVNRSTQYVVEQGGRIRMVRDGAVLPTDFLDLHLAISSDGERGLLGLAFAPDYLTSRRFYVNFTNPAGDTVVSRFTTGGNNLADPASRFDLMWSPGQGFIVQPFANHNGGNLVFGPDGLLYIGLGDGGSANDPDHRAQNPAELLGKMLRIDVNVPDSNPFGYQIPPTNPFVGVAGYRPEIWSFGLRNPWRYSFDDPARGGTGALVIGDVGQDRWEEVDYEPALRGGRNYGWRNREGAHDNVTSLPPAFLPLVDPNYEYDHGTGQSITGGYVYRGRALGQAYRGRYFFADFVAGRIWSLALTVNSVTGEATASNLIEHTAALGGSAQLGNISSFGVGWDGELYVVSYSRGMIFRIEPVTLAPARDGDFDGDRKSDLTLFRPADGIWYVRRSSDSGASFLQWGIAGDIPVPGDYDGDGRLDTAVFRPSTGIWYIRTSAGSLAFLQWGLDGDIPVPGDYDGDGRTDAAVFRPSTGIWYVRNSGTFTTSFLQWGLQDDIPVAADYDGDGKTDVAVYRPLTAIWYIRNSSAPAAPSFLQWGLIGDLPVPGDYDGDGRADAVIFRPSNNTWYVRDRATNVPTLYQWGLSGDILTPGDYDGDGVTDVAVFRPSTGTWYIWYLGTGANAAFPWGLAGDIPIPKRP